jgi:diamine N-acetyltransferase
MSEAVTLREVTDDNRAAVESLRVAPEQERFVATVTKSFADAAKAPRYPYLRAIYAGDEPVGFLMVGEDDDPTAKWQHFLWRFLIDARHQGHGYGRAALDLLTAYVRGRPGGDVLGTSAVPGDGSPIGFYERYGFRPTGEVHGGEHLLELRLAERRDTGP